MRELTIRIRFSSPSLGNQKLQNGHFGFQKADDGRVIFLASWHQSNLRQAAQLIGRYQSLVGKIGWDVHVDGRLADNPWTRIYRSKSGKRKSNRYALHESFQVGQVVGINCSVPSEISDDAMFTLMSKAGTYKGLSPWKPGQYGHYEVVSIVQRARPLPADEPVEIADGQRIIIPEVCFDSLSNWESGTPEGT